MAKGDTANERISRTDPVTGVEILQLTSFPTISNVLTYSNTNFLADSKTFIFLSQRVAVRNAPLDLFRVGTDGSNLMQITDKDGDSIRGIALDPAGTVVYFYHAESIWSVDLETLEETEIAHIAGAGRGNKTSALISLDGRYYLVNVANGPPVRLDTTKGEVVRLDLGEIIPRLAHHSGGGFIGQHYDNKEGKGLYYHISWDGENLGLYGRNNFAHTAMLGRTTAALSCSEYPKKALVTLDVGMGTPEVIVEGHYYWHASSSLDGEWAIADTNWPNDGLILVHIPTKKQEMLVHPGNGAGHPQWTHPHPQFSPDGKMVLYNSDATGICQVYLAHIPDDMRSRLSEL